MSGNLKWILTAKISASMALHAALISVVFLSMGAKEVQAIFGANPERVYSKEERLCVAFIRDTVLKQYGVGSSISAYTAKEGPPKIIKGSIYYRGEDDQVEITNGDKMRNKNYYYYSCQIKNEILKILEIKKDQKN